MRKSWQVLLHNRLYVGVAVALFAVGLILGSLFTEMVQQFVKEGLAHLKELAEQADAKDDPLYTSQLIFWNNLRACVAMLLLGSLYGVFTVLSLLMNGLMIGVVMTVAMEQSIDLFDLIVFGLLPHGIFELPAIFIASAFGMKLGRVLLWPLQGMTRWESYKAVWREVVPISRLVLVLLVVAAGVEGLITPQLLETFAK